ncbi:MAG: Polyferredoxin protein MvhB [Methanosaeta sp. PtaB.Bin039]|nr:MAG: Polyferredoxin protein MvhB [Methanosaeta sp. PtaB.Bin039]HOT06503.1 4Fe-4S binding protein [Methanotrichaceae archaeon]HQF15624.1 4Fe-4S binding protein [Methanotrichaceae archaeon]HQI90360.1 4Fe-4S binding protein [Methanotrichaceae archaeon]HQJ28602.1 4Fe-4S binding protein [Methanotrichaceae archaeon]
MVMPLDKEMEAEGTRIRSVQKSQDSTKVLDYDYKKCIGCGICVDLCPTRALQKGPLIEIATGLDAPPVLIDLDACAFCGMCANFCPVNAFSFRTNDLDIKDDPNYPRLLRKATANDRCLPCTLCEPVCPTDAITVKFDHTRQDFGQLREGISGKIEVDKDKCNLCGICARFCPAFMLLDQDRPDPRNLVPYQQLLVDEELCDYCGLCVGICPEEAIRVEGEPLEAQLDLKGSIDVDNEKCIGCGRCALVCPYQAMDVTRPFEGEIRLDRTNLLKCDPLGCHGCFNVCPADCWYVDDQGRIAVVEEQCIRCGACKNACHCLGIDVSRSRVSHTPILDTPWASEWRDAIASILTGQKRRPDLSTTVVPPAMEKVPLPPIEVPKRDLELLKLIDAQIREVEAVMKKPKARLIWERSPVTEAAEKIGQRMMQSRGKALAQAGSEEGSAGQREG